MEPVARTLLDRFERSNSAKEPSIWNRSLPCGVAVSKVVDLDPLNSVIDLAWAECEMRLSVLEAERGRLWE